MNLDVLRIALAKKNLTQVAIARTLGVDHGTFSRWKRWYPVPQRYRCQLAALLDVSEHALFPMNTPENKATLNERRA